MMVLNASFISKGLADCLQIHTQGTEELSISTFGTQTGRTNKLDVAAIHLHTVSGQLIPLTVLIVPTIAAPLQNLNKRALTDFPYLKGLHLAHPVVDWRRSLLDVVEDHIIRGNGPTAMGSKLGYLLSGPLGTTNPTNTTANVMPVATQYTPNLDLQQFWSVESLGISPRNDSVNTFLEYYIAHSVERLLDGSYSARFLWKESHPALPTNYSTCVRRTRALAHKLAQTPPLLTKYHEILTEQERRGFIEQIQNPTDHTKCHYIPHHAVRKDSQTTPIRIVYDCSCH